MDVIAELTGVNDNFQLELTNARTALNSARNLGASREELSALEQARDVALAEAAQLTRDLSTAQSALDSNNATIAELTRGNDRLLGDFDASELALAAALASQAAALDGAGMT